MYLTAFTDDLFQIDIGAIARRKARVEGGCGLATCLTYLVRLKRTFDHVGYGSIFTTSKSMGQVTGFCATDGELGFGHLKIPLEENRPLDICHQDGR